MTKQNKSPKSKMSESDLLERNMSNYNNLSGRAKKAVNAKYLKKLNDNPEAETVNQWNGLVESLQGIATLIGDATHVAISVGEKLNLVEDLESKNTIFNSVKNLNKLIQSLSDQYIKIKDTIPVNTGVEKISDPDVFMSYLNCSTNINILFQNVTSQLMPAMGELQQLVTRIANGHK